MRGRPRGRSSFGELVLCHEWSTAVSERFERRAVALAGGRLSLRFVQSQEVSVTSWMAICQSDALTVCGLS